MNVWKNSKGMTLDGRFFEVAQRVYAETLYTEDKAKIRQQLSLDNPYLKVIDLEVMGVGNDCRLVGCYNPRLYISGKKAAFFGFWESISSLESHKKLFEAFFSWAYKKGAEVIYGPIDLTTYSSYRIQIQGFDGRPPFPGEPHNPHYYASLLENIGCSCVQEYISLFGNAYYLPTFNRMASTVQKNIEGYGFRIKTLTPEFWLSRLEELYPIFQEIWKDNFGYIPIEYPTFCQFFDRKATEPIDPHTSIVILDSDDKIASYFVMYPDYGPLLQRGVRESELSYQTHFPILNSPGLLMKTGCVQPKYRRYGLFTAMSVLAGSRALSYGYSHPIAAMVRADNPSARMDAYVQRLEKRAVSTEHRYGLFYRRLR